MESSDAADFIFLCADPKTRESNRNALFLRFKTGQPPQIQVQPKVVPPPLPSTLPPPPPPSSRPPPLPSTPPPPLPYSRPPPRMPSTPPPPMPSQAELQQLMEQRQQGPRVVR